MKILKRILITLVIVIVVLVGIAWIAKALWDAHYYDGYDPKAPLNVVMRPPKETVKDELGKTFAPEYRREEFAFDGLPGNAVPGVIALPKEATEPVPCIVFLHGIGQEKEFLDTIAEPFVKAGFAIATYDQYTRGERKLPKMSKFKELLEFRRRGALTVIETRRMIDYLQTRPDIAPDRIYLCGASYGAITGATAAAFDERFRATVLCYGGGNLRLLFDNPEASKMLGVFAGPVKMLLNSLLAPSDPVRHVAEISPRPVLCQNGTHDPLIAKAAAQALYDAAKEPKEIIWYDSGHVGEDWAQTFQVLNEAIDWLKKQDAAVLTGDAAKRAA